MKQTARSHGYSNSIGRILRFCGCFVIVFVLLLSWYAMPALALSPEQKKIFDREIHYYDITACNVINSTPDPASNPSAGEVSGDLQQLAKDMLANSKITYWTNNGVNTRDVVVALSKGEKAYTTSNDPVAVANRKVDLNPNILKFILDVANSGNKIMVNALTDKDHSPNSNHYKGLAVDIDSNAGNSAPASVLNPIAEKYGGKNSGEAGHHHFDFTKAASIQSPPPTNQEAGFVAAASTTDMREKIGQMIFVGATNNKQEMVDVVKKYKVGGVMLTSESTSLYNKAAIDDIKAASGGEPLLIASDEEGGKVQRLKGVTGAYPSAAALGKMSEAQVEKSAKEYGGKLADLGVTVNYAPVADLDNGSNPIISGKDRAFSSNPDEVAKKALAFAKGMRQARVVPVFKHFPGHGSADNDSHVERTTTPPLSVLKKKDLKPYETVMKGGVSGVMVGHLVIPGLTEGDKYEQATINKQAIDLLRGEYSFDQVVFSDEIGNMKAIIDKYAPTEAVSLSIQAGVDMPLFNYNSSYGSLSEQIEKTIDRVENDVKSGKIKESQINAAITRITALKDFTQNGKVPDQVQKDAGDCSCSGGAGAAEATNLSGANAAAKIFNFLIGKGLSDKQAAGIIGNFQEESTLNPFAEEGPPPKGFGLAQWSFGRRTDLIEAMKKAGLEVDQGAMTVKKSNDKNKVLAAQLDFLWKEMDKYPGLKDNLKKINSGDVVAQAALLFHKIYEGSADGPAQIQERVESGKRLLKEFGGGGGGDSTESGGTDKTCVSNTPDNIDYGGVDREQLEQKLLSSPNWKPQGSNPTNDVKNGIAQDDLVRLMLALVEQLDVDIHPSVIKTGHSDCSAGGSTSNHYSGLAVDLGNAGVSAQKMNNTFVWLYQNRVKLKIDELIYEPVPSGGKTLDNGIPFVFDTDTRRGHTDHIHVSVKGEKKKAPGCSG